ncbi:hypothetical protein F383_20816 [Gossypium arboreum]|uniref:Uncharacterized protein n=1 Tax=Gossypium arboreum TaxID=29729 RepID=A0A0B0NWZ3_GOSAR|nr:hypothetical protein F383_20816 [Gossypium arboreum]
MHRPHYVCQCKTISRTWHRRRDKCQCKTCMGYASASMMIASVRHVWDMHQPHYEFQCKTMSGTWHRRRDEC